MRLALSTIGMLIVFVFESSVSAQKKKESKDPVPQIVVAAPLAIEAGKTTKLILRGVKIEDISEIRLHEPKSTGKVIGKSKKVPVPNNANLSQVGDSEVEVEITLPSEVPGGTVPFSVVGPGGESKPHLLIVKDDTPIVMEKEPNDGFKNAQPLSYPCVVEGSIRQSQDVDVFRLDAKQGERLHIELQANRFGSPVDGTFTLYDDAARIVANADDSARSVDPILTLTVAKSGTYYLSLIDAHDQGGDIFRYRLIVRLAK